MYSEFAFSIGCLKFFIVTQLLSFHPFLANSADFSLGHSYSVFTLSLQTVQTQFRCHRMWLVIKATLFAYRNAFAKCDESEAVTRKRLKLEMDSSK